MSKALTPRYSLTISTKDVNMLHRRDAIKQTGKTDIDIYMAGIEALERINIA